jgi:23S rRNA (adenine2503-C2)-methyltransferase
MLHNIDDIRQRQRNLGTRPAHEESILRARIKAKPLDFGRRKYAAADLYPRDVISARPPLSEELAALAQVRSE